ncbi:MAG TPA: Na+/H+ antiporter subunit B [Vicinamibacterales bacterium]|nr:Na+/H+ antiporter subunit B [Vicinamibacterales bacterium]
MTSLILRTASGVLQPVLLLYSIFLLVAGHNGPGGGFAGGLVAASAFALHALAHDARSARRALGVHPRTVLAVGLLVAALSGIWGLLAGRAFLTGLWTELPLPGGGYLPIGTPLLFDAGVYLLVLGMVLLIVFPLAEE